MRFARRLAENGCTVLVPALIDRSDRGSGDPALLMTNEPHREWIHRQAFMMGRHIIGFEVQKVLAAIDWWQQHLAANPLPGTTSSIGVSGYGEGGLIAFYAAAIDPRIEWTHVSGYFKSRQQTWREPLYRDVWGLLREFGDAEIASLIGRSAAGARGAKGHGRAGPAHDAAIRGSQGGAQAHQAAASAGRDGIDRARPQ